MFCQVYKEWSSLLDRTLLQEMYHLNQKYIYFLLENTTKGVKFPPYKIDIQLSNNNTRFLS